MAAKEPAAARQSGGGLGKQGSRDGDPRHLESDGAAVANDVGADLDQLLPQSQQCPERVYHRIL